MEKKSLTIWASLGTVWAISVVGVWLAVRTGAPPESKSSVMQEAKPAPEARQAVQQQPQKQLSFPVKSEQHKAVTSDQMYDLAQVAAAMGRLEGSIKEERLVWAKKVDKALEKLTTEYKERLGKRSDLIEQIAKERRLKVSCFLAFLDEKGQNACGVELWGIGTEGEILVAR
jgi:hypothetical protein